MTTARLENWSLHFQRHGVRLTGLVFGHPAYGEGAQLSMPVQRQQFNPLARTVTTRTAVYQLGFPKYERVQRNG